jgi:hypothetical protein
VIMLSRRASCEPKQDRRTASDASAVLMLSRRVSNEPEHEERASSDASTVPMLSRHASWVFEQHEERTASDASAGLMLSRRASSVTTQFDENASSDPDVEHVLRVLRLYNLRRNSGERASSDQPASPHQHPASPSTMDGGDDFVRTPSNIGVRSLFDLMNASCDPSSPRGAWSNLEANVMARNILRTASAGAGQPTRQLAPRQKK